MSSIHKLTRTFRAISALVYLINIFISVRVIFGIGLIHLMGLLSTLCNFLMLSITIESPPALLDKLRENQTSCLFAFRGRYLMDIFIALLLFQLGPHGIFMASITLIVVFGIRLLGVKEPDAFHEMFTTGDEVEENVNEQGYAREDANTVESRT